MLRSWPPVWAGVNRSGLCWVTGTVRRTPTSWHWQWCLRHSTPGNEGLWLFCGSSFPWCGLANQAFETKSKHLLQINTALLELYCLFNYDYCRVSCTRYSVTCTLKKQNQPCRLPGQRLPTQLQFSPLQTMWHRLDSLFLLHQFIHEAQSHSLPCSSQEEIACRLSLSAGWQGKHSAWVRRTHTQQCVTQAVVGQYWNVSKQDLWV